jgi:hypothetical protein
MDILKEIMNAQGGAAVQQIGSQFGLGDQQAASALSALVPALAGGLQRKAQGEGGLGSLASALSSLSHQQYIDNPQALQDPAAVTDGNNILGHVLGSKDVSRDVAAQAAAQTGISADVMKRMLPLAATLLMGALSRRAGGALTGGPEGGGGIAGMLGSLLDGRRDGAAGGDLAGMLGKLIKP